VSGDVEMVTPRAIRTCELERPLLIPDNAPLAASVDVPPLW